MRPIDFLKSLFKARPDESSNVEGSKRVITRLVVLFERVAAMGIRSPREIALEMQQREREASEKRGQEKLRRFLDQ
jgi:hypothetical protein